MDSLRPNKKEFPRDDSFFDNLGMRCESSCATTSAIKTRKKGFDGTFENIHIVNKPTSRRRQEVAVR